MSTRGLDWRTLLPKLLPKPVEAKENGVFWGGEGPDVIVTVDDEGVHVMEAKISWNSPSHPTVVGKPGMVHALDTSPVDVADSITRVWARQLAKYQWCSYCNERFNPAHMHDRTACHGCAERELGIIH